MLVLNCHSVRVGRENEEIINVGDKTVATEKQVELEEVPSSDVNKENKEGPANDAEEKEEDKVSHISSG